MIRFVMVYTQFKFNFGSLLIIPTAVNVTVYIGQQQI